MSLLLNRRNDLDDVTVAATSDPEAADKDTLSRIRVFNRTHFMSHRSRQYFYWVIFITSNVYLNYIDNGIPHTWALPNVYKRKCFISPEGGTFKIIFPRKVVAPSKFTQLESSAAAQQIRAARVANNQSEFCNCLDRA